ncbi:MAG: class I SAM-dependent methyltransferase [Planctomycetales bacterium]
MSPASISDQAAIVSVLAKGSNDQFLESLYRLLLRRAPDPVGLAQHLAGLRAGRSRLEVVDAFLNCPEFRRRLAAGPEYVPPGHFYSPIASRADVERHRDFDWDRPALPAIDPRIDDQVRLLERFRVLYPTLPFTAEPQPGFRYHYVNPTYSYGDAIMTYCMVRDARPRRIIEVGSGHSSCLILDTNDRFFQGQIECLFMDPHPEYVQSLLGPAETARTTIIPSRLQDADPALFDRLEANDILFIDSTHVSKLNSDVNRYIFEILPRLSPGVLIHFHDVAWPFEYPLAWLEEGRAWNEQYLLRAFLMYNDHFHIRLFTTLMYRFHGAWFDQHMPLCLVDAGGSLWIQKVQ